MTDEEFKKPRLVTTRVIKAVDSEGAAVPDLDVCRVASNGTYLAGRTDDAGEWGYDEFFTGTVTFLLAGTDWRGAALTVNPEDWIDPTVITLEPAPGGGSVIIERGTGYIPGLEGRLNPIRDSLARTYVYGDNLSFDETPDQPFQTEPGSLFTISDAVGNLFRVELVTILGRTSLLTYDRLEFSPLSATAS